MILNINLLLRSQTILKMNKEKGVYSLPCKVNGQLLNFIFDTGASDVSLSFEEAIKMIKLGLLNSSDFLGTKFYKDATGNITEGYKVNIKTLEIDKIILKNVPATILKTNNAPLLLGQSALQKMGQIIFNPQKATLTILNTSLIEEGNTYDFFKVLLNNNAGLIDNFCGFKLLQYEDCIGNQLGEPDFTKKKNSTGKHVGYNLGSNENEGSLIFTLEKLGLSSDVKQIISIQLSGKYSKYSVRGISLGNPISKIKEVFKLPDSISDINNSFGDGVLLEFNDYNLSIESNDGLITSIKVFYKTIDDLTQVNDQISNFKLLKNAIKYFNPKEIMNLFAPDFEILIGDDKPILFNKGFEKDLSSNKEFINFISNPTKGLKSLLNPKIKAAYGVRIQEGVGLLILVKFKKPTYINEIVFRQNLDKFVIWEIH